MMCECHCMCVFVCLSCLHDMQVRYSLEGKYINKRVSDDQLLLYAGAIQSASKTTRNLRTVNSS